MAAADNFMWPYLCFVTDRKCPSGPPELQGKGGICSLHILADFGPSKDHEIFIVPPRFFKLPPALRALVPTLLQCFNCTISAGMLVKSLCTCFYVSKGHKNKKQNFCVSSQFQSILLVVVVTVAQTKIKITKDNWLHLTEIAFCEVHNLQVKFRYSEKATNIWSIFHFLFAITQQRQIIRWDKFLWPSPNI